MMIDFQYEVKCILNFTGCRGVNAIGKNAYYFNSHRMMRRYVTEAYIR